MKKTHNKVTCLFGYHQYSKELTIDKHGNLIRLCKICNRSGYRKWHDEHQVWFVPSEKGNLAYRRWSGGEEAWYDYDEDGNLTHIKWNDGYEVYQDDNGSWGIVNSQS